MENCEEFNEDLLLIFTDGESSMVYKDEIALLWSRDCDLVQILPSPTVATATSTTIMKITWLLVVLLVVLQFIQM